MTSDDDVSSVATEVPAVVQIFAKTQNQLTHVTIRSHLVVSFRQPFNMNHFLTTFNIKKSISTESKDYRSEHHKGFFPPLQSNEHKASL